MIPEKAITKAFVKMAGEQRLFSMAQNNMGSHLNNLRTSGARAYVAHNGKLENGSAANGKDRFYWFSDTEINGSYLPKFKESSETETFVQSLASDSKFQEFKDHVEEGSKSLLSVEPYVDANNAGGNVRLGMRVTAESIENFKLGLEALTESEMPENYGSMTLSDTLPDKRMFNDLDND